MGSESKDCQEESVEEFDRGSIDDPVSVTNVDAIGNEDTGAHTADNIDIYVMETIIKTWSSQHNTDIAMRKKYAKWLLWILAGDGIFVMGIFITIGLNILQYDAIVVKMFLTISYAQLLGMALVIVKYLFSRDSHVILKDIVEVIGKIRKNRGD